MPSTTTPTPPVVGRQRFAWTVLILLAWACSRATPADTITVATWNVNNLHYLNGISLRSRAPARSKADYATLATYARKLDADIIALQEVNGPRAAARVFSPKHYSLHFSGRYSQRTDPGIFTGFAVRKGAFDRVRKIDVAAIGIKHSDGFGTRWGVWLEVRRAGTTLHLLNVHLKSRCFAKSLRQPRSDHCRTLQRQLAPLEDWIDGRERAGDRFMVLGDFNRAFDVHDRGDHLWQEIDDGKPRTLELTRYPQNKPSRCWANTNRHHVDPIDFFVVNRAMRRHVVAQSWRQHTYARADRNERLALPSDHCPMTLRLSLP